jgi:hypothetical protein
MGKNDDALNAILDEAERSVESVENLDDDELLALLSNYERANENLPEGWSGLGTRAAITFELRRRDYDFERDEETLTLTGPSGETIEL